MTMSVIQSVEYSNEGDRPTLVLGVGLEMADLAPNQSQGSQWFSWDGGHPVLHIHLTPETLAALLAGPS